MTDAERSKAWVKAHQRPSQSCPPYCNGVGCYDQQIKFYGADGIGRLAWVSRCKSIMSAQREAMRIL